MGDIDHDFFYGHYNQPVPTFLYPHDDTADVGHFSWDADLVAVEAVGLLAVFAVFVDVVLIGETACVRTSHILRQD